MLKRAQCTLRTVNIYQLPMQVNIREAMIFHCKYYYAVTPSVYAEQYFSTEKWSLRYSVIISLLTCLICAANRMVRNSASVYVCLHTKMAAAVPFITLHELVLATQTDEDCRQWLRGRGLLAQQMTCPRCHTLMEERLYSRVSDGVIWRCPPKNCRATVSVRKASFAHAGLGIVSPAIAVDVDTACHALLSRAIAVTKRKRQRILTDEDDFTAYLYSEFIGAQAQNPVANLRHLPPLFKENVCLESVSTSSSAHTCS